MRQSKQYYLQAFLSLAMYILFISVGVAQGSAGSSSALEPRYLVDVPTAGIIRHGELSVDLDFFAGGGLMTVVSIGAFDRLNLGVSFGGTGIIGSHAPDWNPVPGVLLKIRIIDETIALPAIALGLDTQGKGAYIDSLSRYAIKSPGVYGVFSKNYSVLGFLSVHGGINYSFETGDGDDDPNFFAGLEKSIGPFMSVVGEYNVGMNDSNREALGKGRGYLNFGIRGSLGAGFTIGFNLKDIFRNQRTLTVGDRTFQLEYVQLL